MQTLAIVEGSNVASVNNFKNIFLMKFLNILLLFHKLKLQYLNPIKIL